MPVLAQISARPAPARPKPTAARRVADPAPPTDTFTTAEQVAALPGVNAMLLNAVTFNVAIAGWGSSGLSMPWRLAVGGAQGDMTIYS